MSWRKLHINDQVWEYHCGHNYVVVKSPESKKEVIDYSTLTGRSWDIIERGMRKKTSDGMITPKHIKDYIEKHLIK